MKQSKVRRRANCGRVMGIRFEQVRWGFADVRWGIARSGSQVGNCERYGVR